MGPFDNAKAKFTAQLQQKETKDSGLSDKDRLNKDVQKKNKTNCAEVSTRTATAAYIGTTAISATIHGGLAAWEASKLGKPELTRHLTHRIIEQRNEVKMGRGETPLQRRQPTFMQSAQDRNAGFADGAIGTGAGADASKVFSSGAGKYAGVYLKKILITFMLYDEEID